jgi:hypothetical protein
MDLILTRLLLIEYATINSRDRNYQKLKVIREIRNTLLQVDFMSEIVPLENVNKLSSLLMSLKGCRLTEDELSLVEELAYN